MPEKTKSKGGRAAQIAPILTVVLKTCYQIILKQQMEQTCDDIDEMFSNLLGEMDMLTQSLGVETLPPPSPKVSNNEFSFTVGFKDLNESLSALEDKDLDALMADLVADINDVEQRTLQAQKTSSGNQESTVTQPSRGLDSDIYCKSSPYVTITGHFGDDVPPPPPDPDLELPPPPPPPPPEPLTQEEREAQAKADKIKLALEKLKEAKVKKLVVKVHMYDNSTKSLMVDERQVTRDVLDNLFEKTHCDCSVDWCLYEMYPELQIERFFEDHENVVEVLSDWTRDTENKILFLEKSEKYALFKNPQNFYLANKGKNESKEMNDKNKEALLEESFCGTSVIVPELEGFLYLKEDGKKSWKRRYFLLRASGIYYVPKGKTKTSRDLACFIQFENMNVYYGSQHKVKYKAPTDHCFVIALQIGWEFYIPFRKGKEAHAFHIVQHPQIQKESQYIKYLCCDDQATLHQWVTGIRIAKYGKTLYDNYKCAVKKAGLSSHWANQGTVEPAAPAGGSLSADGACYVCTFWWLQERSPPQGSKDQDSALIKHRPRALSLGEQSPDKLEQCKGKGACLSTGGAGVKAGEGRALGRSWCGDGDGHKMDAQKVFQNRDALQGKCQMSP
ncbi:amyloid beta a4 precursor protein-binding family b member 1-interacting protein [Limosa lapponica baueri]|uniref:Amyloid beta A4 precursor protein-binding family B member 1-interacting protein n=1 Tax=Limosa lapponica baueri TaxID=1758121 RepID=A0A2I0U3K1_LIMLA|nr:amyloid beta a4 precursor protein-binding family b member 1-interacting protein [Limosa lapponica baueri]